MASFLSDVFQGVGDIVGEISGSTRAAQATQGAAEAQLNEARSVRSQTMDLSGRALDLAKASPTELAAYGRSLSAAMTSVDQQERLVKSIDPALMEASQKVLALLRGGSGSGPVSDMYSAQRSRLVQQLRSQYGPGAELTSIGQRALMNFDLQAKQGELQSFSGILGLGQNLQSSLQSGIGTLSNAAYASAQPNQRQIGVLGNTIAALNQSSQPVLQSSGAPFVGSLMQAQTQQGLFNQALNAGAMYAGGAMGILPTYTPGKGTGGGTYAPQASNFNFGNVA